MPAAAVAAHARARPEQPALAFPTAAGTWRWASWAWLAWRVATRAQELAPRAIGSPLAFPWLPSPGGVVTDLAIQAAGCVAVPSPADAEAEAVEATPGWPSGLPPVAAVERWEDQPETARWGQLPARPPREAGAALAAALREGGGVAVAGGHGWTVRTAAELAAVAVTLQGELAIPGRRPLALIPADLAGAAGRDWLAWALAAGAVLVLPGAPELFAWSLAWARPTHACVAAGELAALRAALAELDSAKGLRRRFRRLSHLVVSGGTVGPDELQAWSDLGVRPREWPRPPAP